MNKIFMDGNLVREPELVSTNGDWSLIKFSIANNDESKKDQVTGEWTRIPSFFDCEYWTKNPQPWLNRLQKGKPASFFGRLKQDKWQDKESGQDRYKIKIIVESFTITQFLLSESSDNQPQKQQSSNNFQQDYNDGIPF
jgi:single-strand DNA-binding protein